MPTHINVQEAHAQSFPHQAKATVEAVVRHFTLLLAAGHKDRLVRAKHQSLQSMTGILNRFLTLSRLLIGFSL